LDFKAGQDFHPAPFYFFNREGVKAVSYSLRERKDCREAGKAKIVKEYNSYLLKESLQV